MNALITVKFRFLLALLALLSLLLCSCQVTPLDSSPVHAVQNAEDNILSKDASTHDYLLLPANAGSELVARAHALANALSAQTGIPATLYFDSDDFLMQENARLILLGNVRHALAEAHLHGLRRDDYICVTEENVLILGGKSDAATVAAIDRFSNTLLPYADAEILVNTDQHFAVSAEYALSTVTLNGFSLDDYRIVYPKNGVLLEKEIAYRLRDRMADRCGFYLDVLSDDLVAEEARTIAIGACFDRSSSLDAGIYATDSSISLCGDSAYSLGEAASVLLDRLFGDGTAKTVTLTLDHFLSISAIPPTLTVLSGLLCERDAISNITSVAALSANVQMHLPILLPLSSVSRNLLLRDLEPSLSGYACVPTERTENPVLPLFYREDTLTLRNSEKLDGITQAHFSFAASNVDFTVWHANADDISEANDILNAAASEPSQDEPMLIFLITPDSVALPDQSTRNFIRSTVWETDGLCLHVLLYLPQSLSATEITHPGPSDALYEFTFSHPFLTS